MFLIRASLREMLLRLSAEKPEGILSHFVLCLCFVIYCSHIRTEICLFHMSIRLAGSRWLKAIHLVLREELLFRNPASVRSEYASDFSLFHCVLENRIQIGKVAFHMAAMAR